MSTPSHRRREGRNAYDKNCDPNDFNPYRNEDKRQDWLDGWLEAEQQEEEEEKETIQPINWLDDDSPSEVGL